MSQAISCTDCTSTAIFGGENAFTQDFRKIYEHTIKAFQGNTDTFARPKNTCEELLSSIYHECSEENWDGYDALPVDRAALYYARLFIQNLPLHISVPTDISADTDGHIVMEWRKHNGLVFVISFSGNGELHYAGILGVHKPRGLSYFINSIPKDLLEKIQIAST